MFSEDELLPISGLQHLAFCPRQCALIHLDKTWAENALSAEGRLFHEKVHEGPDEKSKERVIFRSLRLTSYFYGLTGFADVVELTPSEKGIPLSGRKGLWMPIPIEYKRGKPKSGNEDKIQLCAQTFCLEESWNIDISEGFLFYGKTRHREPVTFSEALRAETENRIQDFRNLISEGKLPPAKKQKQCRSCSMQDICQPQSPKSALRYISKMLEEEEL